MKPIVHFALLCMLLVLSPARLAGADEEIVIVKPGEGKFVPIAIEGITGEALSTLRFDLEVLGFEVTTADKAQYLVGGTSGTSLIGRLTDAINKAVLISKEYTGGTPRAQAHAFADAIVELVHRVKGIAQTRVAFKVERGGNSEIFVADYDGHNALAVTQDNTITRDPAWGPRRQFLLYTSYKQANPDIYRHELSSGVRRVFARYPGLNTGAVVSPDGTKVAMILSKGGSPDVYVADIDGGNLRQLTRTKEDESSPTWSPDGRTICFASRVPGRPALYTVPAGGGEMRRLTTAGVSGCTEPDWSPDGKTIVFTANMGGFQICTVPVGGGTATVLTGGEDPSWARNSRTVMFVRRASGRRVLSLLDVVTKRVKDVRQISGNSSQPAWARD